MSPLFIAKGKSSLSYKIILYSLLIAILILATTLKRPITAQTLASETEIYIYHDSNYPTAWYSPDASKIMLDYIKEVLNQFEIPFTIVDAVQLKQVVNKPNPNNSVIIFTQDIAPNTVWNGRFSSPLVQWMWDGGSIIWTGDWEFYRIGHSDGSTSRRNGMEQIPFGRPVTKAEKSQITQTKLGKEIIPSLQGFTSMRPFDLELIRGSEYEAYGRGKNVDIIDPAMISVGQGSFVKIGGTAGEEIRPIERAVYITELVLNRFLGQDIDLTKGLGQFSHSNSGIVYMLPHGDSSPRWHNKYGGRIQFYAHAKLDNYRESMLSDFEEIGQDYSYIILPIPLNDTDRYYQNLENVSKWAQNKNIEVLYTFHPKWKFGKEPNYLHQDTKAFEAMIKVMRLLAEFDSTKGIATWYGWPGREFYESEIETFYDSLPEKVRKKYYLWLDQAYVEQAVEDSFPKIADDLDMRVITELYSNLSLALYGDRFDEQIIVSGYYGEESVEDWQEKIRRRLSFVLKNRERDTKPKGLGVWTFWDVNDGFGERYRAYINGELVNPFR